MRKWFILISILLILLIGGYYVLSFYTVKFIQPQLQKVIGPGLTLAEIEMKVNCLMVRGIQYEDPHSKQKFLQIKEVRIYPSLLSLLKKSLHIKEFKIIQPSFFFFRSRKGVFVGPWMTMKRGKEEKEIFKKGEVKKGELFRTRIDWIRIERGSIDFEDRKVGEPPGQIRLRDIDFEIKGIDVPILSSHSPIQLKGKMEGGEKEGSIDIKGWIDLKTADSETSLKIREIELKTFEPYYRKRVTAEIDSGYLNMESKITINGKKIDAPGELNLVNLQVKEGNGMVFWIPANTLVSLLKQKGHHPKVQFHLKGNIDDPKFNLLETFLTQIAIHLAEVLGIPIKIVDEAIIQDTFKGEKGVNIPKNLE